MSKLKIMNPNRSFVLEMHEFTKRRNAMLEKRSVDALIEFVKTEPYYKKEPLREKFLSASRIVQELTLISMIEHISAVSRETYEWAMKRRAEIREGK